MDFTQMLVITISIVMCKAVTLCTGTDDVPLHLTPLIETGEIAKAKELSLVTHDVIPRSHAGLITVNKKHGNHLFFWFFPAINSDPQAPVLVWLNGGPGISSMIGLFYENGPMRLNTSKGENVGYERWTESWAEKFNMLYIDQPVGVGYSYTEDEQDGYRFTQDGYSKDLYEFIDQFYVLFPEYMSVDLYIGGQSYGGKYVPAFAYHLHTEIRANRSTIPLKGIFLGGPYFDGQTQCRRAADLYEALGVISKTQVDDFQSKFDVFVNEGNYTNIKTQYYFKIIFPVVQIYDKDNYLTLEGAPFQGVQYVMEAKEMRDAVHVGNLSYSVFSNVVNEKFNQDFMVSAKSKLAVLMDNYKVLIFNGDFDLLLSSVMIDAGLAATDWKLQAQYNRSQRQVWGSIYKPKGYYTRVGQFCRVVIRDAGHRSLHDQPEVSRDMMEQFVRTGCIRGVARTFAAFSRGRP